MFYKVPIINGKMDIDYKTYINAVVISDIEAYVEFSSIDDVRESWVEITKELFYSVKPQEPTTSPSDLEVIGQQLVEKDLQILELQQENQTLGQQLVDMDLRLLAGGL